MPFRYATPANQNDLAGRPREAEYLEAWSALIGDTFRREVAGLRRSLGGEPLFFTELEHALAAGVPAAPVPWLGFPRPLLIAAGGDRKAALAAAERRGRLQIGFEDRELTRPIQREYRRQDEYLEWVGAAQRDGSVQRFAFTAEGPEYWEHLASFDREAVRQLYSDFARRAVTWDELAWSSDVWVEGENGPLRIYTRGDYDPYNRVNLEECAAHLTHPANTLGAEIDLAAKATVQRLDRGGDLVNERRRLACCSDFGDPNRNSDPTIGLAANQTVRGGTSLTLADPVGLYIQRFDASAVADPSGNALEGWWLPVRGGTGRTLRAEFAPPAGSRLTLADVRIGAGENLESGGQLAELITMVLYVRAANLSVSEPAAQRCSSRCCVKAGQSPANAQLRHVEIGEPCADGYVNAFPELAGEALNPFSRRQLQRGLGRGHGGGSGDGA